MNESIRLEDVDCPLGCPKNDEVILAGRDLLHGLPGEFNVVKCGTCGLMRTNPRPTRASMGFYYPDEYGPYQGSRVQQTVLTRRSGIRQLISRVAKTVFKFNTSVLPPLLTGRMLEVGCASGSFMHSMAEKGWEVEGVEFSAKAAESARQLGYRVQAGSLETAPEADRPFDLIIGWMVLEHLHDPVGGLKKLFEWSKPDAWMVLSVPNVASLEYRFFKSNYYALQVPTHLYHFTPHTLRKVLRAGGWELEKVYHQRILSNLIGSMGYVARDRGFPGLGQNLIDFPERSGYWAYWLYPLAWLLSFFGQTGRMTVWARKCTGK